jgi:hypothetical protein
MEDESSCACRRSNGSTALDPAIKVWLVVPFRCLASMDTAVDLAEAACVDFICTAADVVAASEETEMRVPLANILPSLPKATG